MDILSIVIALDVLGLLLCLIGFFDVRRRPDWAWQEAGQNRTLWVVLTILGFLMGMGFFAGWIIAITYFFVIRPKVALAEKGSRVPSGRRQGSGML